MSLCFCLIRCICSLNCLGKGPEMKLVSVEDITSVDRPDPGSAGIPKRNDGGQME